MRASKVKKLVTVLVISTPVIVAREEAVSNLAQVPCIQYPINFRKNSELPLFDSSSKVNTIYPTFAKELGLPIRPTHVGAQKIDGTTLNIFRMIVAAFAVTNNTNQIKFFEEVFLVANVSPEVVLEMLFFTPSGPNIDISSWKLLWRIYTIKEAFPTRGNEKEKVCSYNTWPEAWDPHSSYCVTQFYPTYRISQFHFTQCLPFLEASNIRFDCRGSFYKSFW